MFGFRLSARTALPVVLVLLLLAGCGVFESSQGGGQGGAGGEKVLNDYAESDIPDLNSTTATASLPFTVLTNVMEDLYRLDANEEPVPAMAESAQISDDKLTYTFKLRDGVTWSNGDPVTSSDFEYAWLRAMDPDTAGSYSFILSDFIEGGGEFAAGKAGADAVGIETPDDKTLVVKLANPTPFFLSLTAFPTYFPLNEEFVEQRGDKFGLSAGSILYNGPYTLTELNPTSRAVLTKNQDYWDKDNVDIDRVNLRIVKDASAALNLYEAGELDLVGLTSDSVDQYRSSPEFFTVPAFETVFLYLNNEGAALANENIRRAIQMGFDRQVLADKLLGNGSRPSEGVVPPGMAGPGGQTFREAAGGTMPAFDPGRARELYERGVRELGEEPTLELLSSDDSTAQDTATFLQSQFEDNLGAEVNIRVRPFDSLLEAESSGDYQMGVSSWIADYNDPMNFLDLYTTDSSFNYPNFSDERYDRLIAGARTEADPEARMQMMIEAEKVLMGEGALAPLYHAATADLAKPYVKNHVIHPFGATSEYKYWRLEE